MQLASFFYRNFDGDSPLSRLSGHARECAEMAALFNLGSARGSAHQGQQLPRHFICVDEYGKGTEDTHATALCCAALERLDRVRMLSCLAMPVHQGCTQDCILQICAAMRFQNRIADFCGKRVHLICQKVLITLS